MHGKIALSTIEFHKNYAESVSVSLKFKDSEATQFKC